MTDPFETLGIEPTMGLDSGAVEKRYRELLRVLHPDRHVAAAPSERRLALGKAASVNEAWRVVKDPLRRAEALFRRHGVPLREGTEPPAAPAFLMEVMEQREALGDARKRRDVAAVQLLGEQMRAQQTAAIERLARAFELHAGEPEALAKSVPLLGELRYYRRFLDEVSSFEDEFL